MGSFFIPSFHFIVHCSTALAINNCAVLVSSMRKLLIFLFQEGSVLSSIILWSLSPCSAESGKSVSAAKTAFAAGQDSWAAMHYRPLQPYPKPSKVQLKMGEKDDGITDMFIVFYKRRQPHRARIPYIKNNILHLKKECYYILNDRF